MTEFVLYRCEESVAVITLNRPERRNAVDGALAAGLRDAVERAERDEAVRCSVLTGAGTAFCAGADLREFAENGNEAAMWIRGGFAGFVRLPRTKPIIAAVNGPAIAGGFEVALACDLIVADELAQFALPESSRGLFAAAGAAFRLPRRLPYHVAMDLLLLGSPLSAADAHRWGLVNRVAAAGESVATARQLANVIAATAPLPIAATLRLARLSTMADEETLWACNDEDVRPIMASADAAEGTRAFLERREPEWRGR